MFAQLRNQFFRFRYRIIDVFILENTGNVVDIFKIPVLPDFFHITLIKRLRKQGIEAVFPIQIDTLAMVCQPEREAAAFFFADSSQSLIQIEILQHNIAVVDTFKMSPFEAKGKRDAVVFQQYHIFADMLLITRKAIFLTALAL